MQTCENPFLIWFTGRTGSTFLCDLLDSHPQISCRKEQFCEVKIEAKTQFPKNARTFTNKAGTFARRLFADQEIVDDPNTDQTSEYLASILNSGLPACGFKLKFPNQSFVYPEVVQALKAISGLKVIELVRENVLKQAVSLRNVKRIQDLGVSKSSNAVEEVNLEPLELDVELTIKHAMYFLRSREDFFDFSRMFANVLPIRYEQMLENRDKTIRTILEFLEVDRTVQLCSEFKKATPDRLAEAVSNYDELATAVQGTGLEQFLD